MQPSRAQDPVPPAYAPGYQQDAAKRQTASIVVTQTKIFALQGQLVAQMHLKFGMASSMWLQMAMQNFTLIDA